MRTHPFDLYPEHSTEPYGVELAEAVAERLDQGFRLGNFHRDFCGYGLDKIDGEYVYDELSDGYMLTISQLNQLKIAAPERRAFSERSDFISWLAKQSDESLCGRNTPHYGNQRIDRWRLTAFVEGND